MHTLTWSEKQGHDTLDNPETGQPPQAPVIDAEATKMDTRPAARREPAYVLHFLLMLFVFVGLDSLNALFASFAPTVTLTITPVVKTVSTTGAVVMGRHSYDMGQGDFTDYEYQVPIFVLTHTVPEHVIKGENDRLKVTFVTDGIQSAIEKAKAAAGDKQVTVVGGANTAQQCLRAGLVDEIHIGIVPILLGEGLRFFEPLVTEQLELERTRVFESPMRTDLWFRVVK